MRSYNGVAPAGNIFEWAQELDRRNQSRQESVSGLVRGDPRANCYRGPDDSGSSDDFYPESSAARYARTAKAICRGCVLMDSCAKEAALTGERFAVMGGLTARERNALKKNFGDQYLQNPDAEATIRQYRGFPALEVEMTEPNIELQAEQEAEPVAS